MTPDQEQQHRAAGRFANLNDGASLDDQTWPQSELMHARAADPSDNRPEATMPDDDQADRDYTLAEIVQEIWGQPWRRLAACRGTEVALFFPERGDSTREAKAVCRVCPVREPCLEDALTRHEWGIWGGVSERGRRIARRDERAADADHDAA